MTLPDRDDTRPARDAPGHGATAVTLAAPPHALGPQRPVVRGKFLYAGDEKIYVKGVPYGPFRPGPDGEPYDPARLDADFTLMREMGINGIRLYTLPPRWLLDRAA